VIAQQIAAEPERMQTEQSLFLSADPTPLGATMAPEVMVLEHDWDEVRRLMWDYVGIVRDRERLEIARGRLRSIRRTVERLYNTSLAGPELIELRNIALLGELIVLCARSREESRGLHYTLDFPTKADGPPQDSLIALTEPLAGENVWQPATGGAS